MIDVKNFYQVLEELLEYQGYELLFSGKGKIVGKSAEDNLRSLVVAGERVHEDDLQNLEDSEGEKILVVFEEIQAEMREKIPPDVEIWGRDDLVKKLGKMTLEKSVLEGFAEGEAGISGPDFEVEHRHKEATLKPIIDFDEVSELGDKMVKGFKYRLELVPHYLYFYRVKKPNGDMGAGKLYLNAISGTQNFWKKPFERVSDIRRSHVKLEPNISKDKGDGKALEAVRDRYSFEKEEKWREDGATIVEKREEGPSKDEVNLEEKGIVYVPMWAVEGTEGVVVINAATGKVESEPDRDFKVEEKKD